MEKWISWIDLIEMIEETQSVSVKQSYISECSDDRSEISPVLFID